MQVQRSGFPVSLLKSDFILRYRWCAPASIPDSQLDPTKLGDKEKGENVVCETLLTLGRDLAGGGSDWGEGASGWRLGRVRAWRSNPPPHCLPLEMTGSWRDDVVSFAALVSG